MTKAALRQSPAERGLTPTQEQESILRAVAGLAPGQLLKIQARAGTGKTSTLELLAWADQRPMLYLAYNADINAAAKKRFPATVTCKTTHGLAFTALHIAEWIPTKGSPRNLRAWEVARWLNARRWQPGLKTGASQADIAADVLATLRAFMHSNGDQLDWIGYARCVQRKTCQEAFSANAGEENPDNPSMAERSATASFDRYRLWLVEKASALWQAMVDPSNGAIPLEHDAYLKLYQLQRPVLDYPLILLDEAQDTNPCVMELFLNQPASKIMVGDDAQAIYGFRGARDALKIPGMELPLLQSFRFGTVVAEIANRVLALKPAYRDGFHRLRGTDAIDTQEGMIATPPYAVICRSNQGVFMAALRAAQQGLRINSGAKDLEDAILYVESAWALLTHERLKKLHPEIAEFGSWDVLEQESQSDKALAWLVKLVTEHREDMYALCHQLRAAKSQQKNSADVLVMTAHKCKGLEFDRVVLFDDFAALDGTIEKIIEAPLENQALLLNQLPEQELHLLYVAATRAKLTLQLNTTFHLMDKLETVINRIKATHAPLAPPADAPTPVDDPRAVFAAFPAELQRAMRQAAQIERWTPAQWRDEVGIVAEILRESGHAQDAIRVATGIYRDIAGVPAAPPMPPVVAWPCGKAVGARDELREYPGGGSR